MKALAGILCLAALGLAPAHHAQAVKFVLSAPKPGSIAIMQISGQAKGSKPPRLKLLNPGELGKTVIASATWRASTGSPYDGIVVLLNPKSTKSTASQSGPTLARFSSDTMLSVRAASLPFMTLKELLEPNTSLIHTEAESLVCKNNLKDLGPLIHQYHANKPARVSVATFLHQACGAALDQVISDAPRFWQGFNARFCGFFSHPFRRQGRDGFRFDGSCNTRLQAANFTAPASSTISCVPFPGSTCGVYSPGVRFNFSSPPPAQNTNLSGAWIGLAQKIDPTWPWLGEAFARPATSGYLFPIDPTRREPAFPF